MSTQRWASRDKTGRTNRIYIWPFEPVPDINNDYTFSNINWIGAVAIQDWTADPSNTLIAPGTCVPLQYFRVAAKASHRWWLALPAGFTEPSLFRGDRPPLGPSFVGDEHCLLVNSGGSYLELFGVELQPGQCVEITDKVARAREKTGKEGC